MKPVKYMIHAQDAHAAGYLGRGIGIAYLDTGIAPHTDFQTGYNRKISFVDLLYHKKTPYDDNGHGTHIIGIAASKTFGIAPASDIISIKVLDAYGNGTQHNFLKGLFWIHHHFKEYNVRIVNISVGSPAKGPNYDHNTIVHMVNQLWDDGLIVCVASGNHGPKKSSISCPGNSKKVITVGSSNDANPSIGSSTQQTHYSSRGPTFSCVIKPDLVAPGTNIPSLNPHGRYQIKSGTSMATPIVSGSIALLLEKYPHLTNKEVKIKCKRSCDNINTPKYHQGWGQLNVKKLLDIE